MMIMPGNAQAQGQRSEQQDAFAFSDLADEACCAHSGALCVLCDGMGGHAAGGDAARAAVARFLASYNGRDPTEAIARSLEHAMLAANDAVLDVASQAGDSGSTLVAAVLHDGLLRWISVGDSRLMLLREGRLYRVNREHRHRSELLRSAANGDLGWDEAQNDPLGEHLVSSLGEPVPPQVDRSLRPLPLRPGDQVYLASDGLYRTVAEPALLEAAWPAGSSSAAPPDEVCAAWVALALAAQLPSQDNITVAGLAWSVICSSDAPKVASLASVLPLDGATAEPLTAGTAGREPGQRPNARVSRRSATAAAVMAAGALGLGASWYALRHDDSAAEAPTAAGPVDAAPSPPAKPPPAQKHAKASKASQADKAASAAAKPAERSASKGKP